MTRALAWIQIVIILSCIAYSTYWLFRGSFDQALLPYPFLILYYLFFSYRKRRIESTRQDKEEVSTDNDKTFRPRQPGPRAAQDEDKSSNGRGHKSRV